VDAGGRGFVDGGLWSSDLGLLYLIAQREAVERGVTIRRIFIIDRPLTIDADFTGVVDQHVAVGVEVRILNATNNRTKRHLTQLDHLHDFIVFDDALAYQSFPASRVDEGKPPIIFNTRLVTDETAVANQRTTFDTLWKEGTAYGAKPTG